MRYDAILLDADGTLFDFEAAERHAFEAVCGEAGLECSEAVCEAYRRINDALWKQLEERRITSARLRVQRFEELLVSAGVDGDAVALSQSYVRHLARGTQLLSHAERVCRELARAHRLVLITNGLADVQRPRFQGSALHPHFCGIVISEEAGSAKPDRKIFDEAMRCCGVDDASRALMVGDNFGADIVGGINCGMDTCWVNAGGVTNEGPRPTYEIKHIGELLPIIAEPANARAS